MYVCVCVFVGVSVCVCVELTVILCVGVWSSGMVCALGGSVVVII